MPPSDTFFTQGPHWDWLIVFYFFFGGLAAGSFFLAAMVDLFGTTVDRPLARLGYITAFIALLPAAPLLIIDLNRPERFWHMLIQANRLPLPILKWWSPMSAGSWAIFLFGFVAFLMVLGALAEAQVIRWAPLRGLRHPVVRAILATLGGVTAFFVASYTGVLLSVTNRPVWADSNLLGLLFLVSAASTSAALLLLLTRWRGRVAPESVRWLRQMDLWTLWLELFVLALFLLSLGSVVQVWWSVWGLLLLVVVLGGILLPVLLHGRPALLGNLSTPLAAILVLVGGFLLRAVIVLSSESIEGATAWLRW